MAKKVAKIYGQIKAIGAVGAIESVLDGQKVGFAFFPESENKSLKVGDLVNFETLPPEDVKVFASVSFGNRKVPLFNLVANNIHRGSGVNKVSYANTKALATSYMLLKTSKAAREAFNAEKTRIAKAKAEEIAKAEAEKQAAKEEEILRMNKAAWLYAINEEIAKAEAEEKLLAEVEELQQSVDYKYPFFVEDQLRLATAVVVENGVAFLDFGDRTIRKENLVTPEMAGYVFDEDRRVIDGDFALYQGRPVMVVSIDTKFGYSKFAEVVDENDNQFKVLVKDIKPFELDSVINKTTKKVSNNKVATTKVIDKNKTCSEMDEINLILNKIKEGK